MKTEEQIKFKINELCRYRNCYDENKKPTPEGLIFMIQGLEWVIDE